MKQIKKLLKKVTAVTAASALLISGGTTVLADSYQEAEKAALSRMTAGLAAYWDASVAQQEKAMAGSSAVMKLTLEDAGKSLLSMLAGGMDFSWLNHVSMDMKVAIQEGKEISDLELLLNDSPLCSMKLYMDLAEMTEYYQIPELSESWVKIPLMAAMELSEEEGAELFEDEAQAQEYQQYMEEYQASMERWFRILSDFTEVLPDTETVTALADRYGNLVIDQMKEASALEETLSVEGISEACTAYESEVTEEDFLAMTTSVLETAKEDQELKGLLEKWAEAGDAELYSQFQESVNELLAEASEQEPSEENSIMFTSKVWTNDKGMIKGREIGISDGTQVVPLLTWKSPSADGTSALLIELSADDSSLTLTGTGQTAENLLNGEYVFAIDGVKTAVIQAENVTANQENLAAGAFEGTYTVSFLADEASAEPNPLAAFELVVYISSDTASGNSQMDFTLVNSGAPLLSLSLTGGYADTPLEAPDPSLLDAALDLSQADGEAAYTAGIDAAAIVNNAVAAGVPEELITALLQAMENTSPETVEEEQES